MQKTVGFKETRKGGLLVLGHKGKIVALRPDLPQAWIKPPRKNTWFHAWPDVDIGAELRALRNMGDKAQASEHQRRKRLAFLKFFERVPEEVSDVLALPWPQETWALFSLLCRVPDAMQLVNTGDLNLAFALAESRIIKEQPVTRPLRSARTLVSKSRKEILRWLDLPSEKSFLKALRKVPVSNLNVSVIKQLGLAYRHEAKRKSLQHADRITGVLVALLQSGGHVRLGADVVAEAQLCDSEAPKWGKLLSDTLSMELQLGAKGPSKFSSLDELKRTHDLFAHAVKEQRRTDTLPPFPKPPACKSALIDGHLFRPLRKPADMFRESEAMDHCLGHYGHVERCYAGGYYTFAVEGWARATLAVESDDEGRWCQEELQGKGNSPVAPRTLWAAHKFVLGLNPQPGGAGGTPEAAGAEAADLEGYYGDDRPF